MTAYPLRANTIPCPCCSGRGQIDHYTPSYIRYVRQQRGLSINVASGLMGISASYLTAIELGYRGTRHLPDGVVRQIMEWERPCECE